MVAVWVGMEGESVNEASVLDECAAWPEGNGVGLFVSRQRFWLSLRGLSPIPRHLLGKPLNLVLGRRIWGDYTLPPVTRATDDLRVQAAGALGTGPYPCVRAARV